QNPAVDLPAPMNSSEPYLISVEDVIEVSVFGQPQLSQVQAVPPDGKLSLPLIGSVQAAGLSPTALQELLTTVLGRYYKEPRVTVVVKEYRSRKVFILGQVRTPGLLRMGAPITLLEGLALAGGIGGDADLTGALFIRDGQIVPVNFRALLRQGDFRYN